MAIPRMVVVVGKAVSNPETPEDSVQQLNSAIDAEDLVMKNLKVTGLRGGAVTISQCTRFSGAPGSGNCTNSEFQIRDITVDGLVGTTKDSRVASFQCSAVKPCTNLALFNIDLKLASGVEADRYLCGNVVDPRGFNCTGPACVGGSATGGC